MCTRAQQPAHSLALPAQYAVLLQVAVQTLAPAAKPAAALLPTFVVAEVVIVAQPTATVAVVCAVSKVKSAVMEIHVALRVGKARIPHRQLLGMVESGQVQE